MLALPTDFSSYLLSFIWKFSLYSSYFSFILGCLLIFFKIYTNHQKKIFDKRLTHFIEMLHKLLYTKVALELKELKLLKKSEKTVVISAALQCLRNLRGADEKKLLDILSAWNLMPDVYQQIKNGDRSKKIESITLLGYFKDAQSLKKLLSYTNSKDQGLQLAALRSLARRNAFDCLTPVLQELMQFRKGNYLLLAEIFSGFSKEAIPYFSQCLSEKEAPNYLKRSILMAFSYINSLDAVISTIELFKNPDSIIRTQVLRTLISLSAIQIEKILEPALIDPDFHVRVVAVQAIGKFKIKKFMNALVTAFSDPVWAVRYAAAMAVFNFGHAGVQLLRALSDRKTSEGILAGQVLLERND